MLAEPERAIPAATALAVALKEAGLECVVEPIGAMALLKPSHGTTTLWSQAQRGQATTLARDAGFTHVAVELEAPES